MERVKPKAIDFWLLGLTDVLDGVQTVYPTDCGVYLLGIYLIYLVYSDDDTVTSWKSGWSGRLKRTECGLTTV